MLPAVLCLAVTCHADASCTTVLRRQVREGKACLPCCRHMLPRAASAVQRCIGAKELVPHSLRGMNNLLTVPHCRSGGGWYDVHHWLWLAAL